MTFTNDSTAAPARKNTTTLRIALRLDPVVRLAISNAAGPSDRAEFLEDRKEAEELRRPRLGNHAGEERSAERLGSTLHCRDHQREDVEIALGLHVVRADGQNDVHGERDEDRRLRADAAGEHPEEKRERNAGELDQQNGGDQRALIDAELGAVARGQPMNRADAVGCR